MGKTLSKRILGFMMILMMVITATTVVGCSKDDDDANSITSLSGTQWSLSDNSGTININFTSSSACKVTGDVYGTDLNLDCTYSYDADDQDGTIYYMNVVVYYFEVSGNNMKLYDSDWDYLGTIKKK